LEAGHSKVSSLSCSAVQYYTHIDRGIAPRFTSLSVSVDIVLSWWQILGLYLQGIFVYVQPFKPKITEAICGLCSLLVPFRAAEDTGSSHNHLLLYRVIDNSCYKLPGYV